MPTLSGGDTILLAAKELTAALMTTHKTPIIPLAPTKYNALKELSTIFKHAAARVEKTAEPSTTAN